MNATAKARAAEASGDSGDPPDPAAVAFADQWRAALEAEVARYTVIVNDLHDAADRAQAKHDERVAMSEANLAAAVQMAADGADFLDSLHAQLEGI